MKIEAAEKIAQSAVMATMEDIMRDNVPFRRFGYYNPPSNLDEADLIVEIVSCLTLLESIHQGNYRFGAVFEHSQTAFKKVKDTKSGDISPEVSIVLLKNLAHSYDSNIENTEIKTAIEDCTPVLVRNAIELPELNNPVFRLINNSSFTNKPVLIREFIEHDRKSYSKKGYSRQNLDGLTASWYKIADFLSADDLRWLKQCYAQPRSFIFQAKGTLKEFNKQLDQASPIVNNITSYAIVCMVILSSQLASRDHELIDKCSLPVKEANTAHSQTNVLMGLIYTCFTAYVLTIPYRVGSLITSSYRLFKTAMPLPNELPRWIEERLASEELKLAGEDPGTGATCVPFEIKS